MNFHNTVFSRSAFAPEQFIQDGKPHVAFAGRSNVGKSSVINTLTGRKQLARVGNAPGKTRCANFFLADRSFYLVDLPGYGYAKVSQSTKTAWAELMERYFTMNLITVGVLLVDARHTPTDLDVKMASYFQQTCLPWLVLANKADKLKKNALALQMQVLKQTLVLDDTVPLIAFSCESGLGKTQAITAILTRI